MSRGIKVGDCKTIKLNHSPNHGAIHAFAYRQLNMENVDNK